MKKIKLLMFALLLGLSSNTWAQSLDVSGVVVDDQNVTMPGVSVIVKGTTNGTVTGIDGQFAITVSEGTGALVFSFVGFETQEIALDGKTTLYKVQLATSTIGLNEVVAIGYGSTKKSDLTGSVTSLNSEKLTEMKKTDVGQAIQGQLAGVDVRRTSSKPGAPMSIRIRGNTAIKNGVVGKDGVSDNTFDDKSSPLYVVDGIFMASINNVNPSDIEKMDVLKDASATAIYGSRGSNGVIIVTTKSGKEGKTQIFYDGSFGINSVVNAPDMMNGDKYVAFVDDALKAKQWEGAVAGGNGNADFWNNMAIDRTEEFRGDRELSNVANGNYTDWADMFRSTSIQTSHSVGFSGGKDGLLYHASVGYLKDEGVIGIEQFERYTANASVEKTFGEIFTVGLRNYFTYSEREQGSNELFRSTLRLAPTVDAYDDEGLIREIPDEQDQRFINPIYEDQGSWTRNDKAYAYNASLFFEVRPTTWLKYRSTFSTEVGSNRYGEHRGLLTKAARNDQSRTRAYYYSGFSNSYTWDNVIDASFDVMPEHKLKATLISSLYNLQQEGSRIETRNLDSDHYGFYNTKAGTDVRDYSTWYSKRNMVSFAARLNYDIKGKYLFTFTGRYDGSSMLATGHEWDFFPSAAFAWRVTEEDYMKDVDWLSNLKLRLSYGESGNIKTVWPYMSQAALGSNSYMFGDNVATGKYVDQLANSELTWEVSDETNIGVDFGFLNNRIRIEADYYNKETNGAIFGRELMTLTGFAGANGNYGSVRNRGIELVLNTVNIEKGDFKWTTNINFSKNKNEILKLEGDTEEILLGRHGILKVGESITAMYAYEKEGIWQMDEAAEAAVYFSHPGKYKFKDQNNDDVLNEEDKVVIGSHEPDWIGGMTNSFKYKNFDMSVMVYTRQGMMGHSEFYQNFAPYQNDGAKFNKIDMDYWTPNNPNAEYPMPKIGHPGEWYFEDMSFVKVGNIGFGYAVPRTFLNKFNISSCRLSLDIQNPFTFTDYNGPDPETGLQNSYGMAYSTKTVLFGLSLKF